MKYFEIKNNIVVTQYFKPEPNTVEGPDDVWPGSALRADGTFEAPPATPTDYQITGYDPLVGGWIFKKIGAS